MKVHDLVNKAERAIASAKLLLEAKNIDGKQTSILLDL